MRIMKTKEETREVEYIEAVVCDLCGAKTSGNKPWAKGNHDAIEVDVCMRTWKHWPEGGSGEDIQYDICPTCFRERLMPWLLNQGAAPRIKDLGW